MSTTSRRVTRFPHALFVLVLATACGEDHILDPETPASIVLDRTIVSFSTIEGGADPAPQSVSIANGGDQELRNVEALVSYAPGQPTGWLAASLSTTSAPATLTLTSATTGIPAGGYEADVIVSASGAGNSPQAIAVTLTVAPAPPSASIVLSETSFDMFAFVGGPNPSATAGLTNGGTGNLEGLTTEVSYGAGQPTGWLSVSLGDTFAPTYVALSPVTGDLQPGTYDATVDVASPDADNSPRTIDVTLEIAPAGPSIALSRTLVIFNAAAGGADPAAQTIEVTNIGIETLDALGASVSYGSGQPTGWLDAALDATTAPATLTLTATTGSLAVEQYEATVSVTSAVANNSPRTIDVTFMVDAGLPDLTVASAFVVTPSTVAAGDVANMPEVTYRNQGSGFASSIQNGFYLSADATITTSDVHIGGNTVPTLGAGADFVWPAGSLEIPSSTPPGDYFFGILTDHVGTVTESDESNNFVSAPLTVAPAAPSISLAETAVRFDAEEGGANPQMMDVLVTNGGGGTLDEMDASVSYSGGPPPRNWLSGFFEKSTTAPSLLTLAVSVGALPAGTYGATVDVTAPDAPNSPQSMDVTLVVTPVGTPMYSLSVPQSPNRAGSVARAPNQASYAAGTAVSLTATPATGYEFVSWSGDATGSSNPIEVVMDQDRSITANYDHVAPDLSGSSSSTGAIELTWTYAWPCDHPSPGGCLASSLDHYELEESLAPSGGFGVALITSTTRTSPYTQALTRSPGTYYYRVRAVGSAWQSPYSDVVSVSVAGPAAPLPPTDLTATTASSSQIDLAWTDNSDDETGFRVEMCDGSGCTNFVELGTVIADTNSEPITGLDALTTYRFRVRAAGAGGDSDYSNVATATTDGEVERTIFASYDNLLQFNSTDDAPASNVYSGAENSVGYSFFYDFMGNLTGYLGFASIMWFDVQSIVAGREIVEARLLLHSYILPGDYIGTFRLAAVLSNWSPGTITWNAWLGMSYSFTGAIDFAPTTTGAVAQELDVTQIVQGWADGTLPDYGLQLWDPGVSPPGYESYQTIAYESLDVFNDASRRPQLYIRYR